MNLTALFVVPVVVVIAVVALFRIGILGKKLLPQLPTSGPLPLDELSKYYELKAPPLAWERVRGWDLNQPVDLNSPAPIDQVVLTHRLLDFCSGATGKLELVFNFLVEAIRDVRFEPSALPQGVAAPGQGLVTVFTPSGEARLIATADFARVLQRAVAQARSQAGALATQ